MTTSTRIWRLTIASLCVAVIAVVVMSLLVKAATT